jgi:hypothetical protein
MNNAGWKWLQNPLVEEGGTVIERRKPAIDRVLKQSLELGRKPLLQEWYA